MNAIKVRKNFILDKEIVDKAQEILRSQHKNFTEVINLYFKAIVKDPSILETIEKSANMRTGSFIGLLDGQVGDSDYKALKKEYISQTKKL
ncbi:MAG: hypothetical protein COB07_12540 [Sulfurovum sp.]|nr:MAG: hypothetical protein COB07_12540 [Sulfurovum sp.]